MKGIAEPEWTDEVDEAEWIADRLSAENWPQITSFVPRGFEAYARILHPADEPGNGPGRLVRWHEVAEWSGMPLRNDAQFHSVAMAPHRPATPSPFRGGPRVGSLYGPDALALATLGQRWTTTPDRGWFCVWEGYGWIRNAKSWDNGYSFQTATICSALDRSVRSSSRCLRTPWSAHPTCGGHATGPGVS